MNKTEMISYIAQDTGETQATVRRVLDAMQTNVQIALTGGHEVRVTDMFVITVTKKPARTGRNPATGEAIAIPAKNAVKIKPAKALTDAANDN